MLSNKLHIALIFIFILISIFSFNTFFKTNPNTQTNSPLPTELALQINSISNSLKEMKQSIQTLKQNMDKNNLQVNAIQAKIDSTEPNNEVASTEVEEPDPEELQELADEQFRANIQLENEMYDAESTDPNWAPMAETKLEMRLEEFEDQFKFTTDSIDCKSTRCKSTVNFQSYELAEEYGNRLAEIAVPGLNCSQSIYLPKPDAVSARYEASLILDCSNQVLGKN